MSAPENPRAFPSGAISDAYGGMSLRDHFAGLAMQGWLASYGPDCDHPVLKAEDGRCLPDVPANIARCSYAIADAMLAERERGKAF